MSWVTCTFCQIDRGLGSKADAEIMRSAWGAPTLPQRYLGPTVALARRKSTVEAAILKLKNY